MTGRYIPSKAPIKTVHTNIDQELIVTTEDKVRLCLNTHLHRAERRREWIAPLGLLISVIGMFVSADFKNAAGLSAAEWRAFFFVSGLISAGWLLYAISLATNPPTVDTMIQELKNAPR